MITLKPGAKASRKVLLRRIEDLSTEAAAIEMELEGVTRQIQATNKEYDYLYGPETREQVHPASS